MNLLVSLALPAVVLVAMGIPSPAAAHWCDCLWDSRYNIVVRPAVDSIEVPSSGQVTFTVWLQNNMGYPLYDYRIQAHASGYTISVSIDSATRPYAGFVMPGERLRHDLFVSRSGGGTLSVDDIGFYVGFGHDNVQPRLYGSNYNNLPSADVVVKHQADGSVYPPSVDFSGGSQARHLISSAHADFATSSGRATGINNLLNEYCAGRSSWSTGDPCSPDTSYCPTVDGSGDTTCPSPRTSTSTSKYMWQHLWAAGELAYRKSALSANQLQALRDRLRCGQDDTIFAFKAYALFALGYLGAGSFSADVGGGTVAGYLGGMANTTSAEGCAANAALLMAGGSNVSAVTTCLGNSNQFAQILAGAALNVSGNDPNDTHMKAEVLDRVDWTSEPEVTGGLDLFAAHVANVVAWHHRGWAAQGNDAGIVSFYNEENVPPRAPAPSCSVTSTNPPTFEVTWPQVRQDTNSQNEVYAVGYRIYWGTGSGDYRHVAYTPGTSFSPPGIEINTNYYVMLVTVDDSLNVSADSSEIVCNVPIAADPPVAHLNCNTAGGACSLDGSTLQCGTAPVTVECSCDCVGVSWSCDPSTDPQDDIEHCWISFGGSPEDALGTTVTHTFSDGGSISVTLEAQDATGLSDTDSLTVAVNDPGGNAAPTADVTATPTEGTAPLKVYFTGGGSDSDGSIVGWAWDFDDNGSTDSTVQSPIHTFTNSGEYNVRLTVTDDGSPALTGTDVVRITASDQALNRPPPNDCGAVNPIAGRVPLTISLDASACVDPDGDNITFDWSVGSWQVASVDLTGQVAQHTLTERGDYTVSLTMVDDGSPPRQVSQSFEVTVTEGDAAGGELAPLVAGCSCESSRSPMALWFMLVVVPWVIRRRRR